ncbi:ribosome assembly factor SBDS [Candidatus Woesearchaeota archaeon]|jgi:ribosome maturation protein SDO1|nr:ribosome assembly factor SBDS [Candidatus Woesearchaeota archaeon]
MVRITHDHEKVQFNLARLKKEGEIFEIVVEPSLAIQFKEGNDVDISEILKSEKIFSDAKKGLLASEHKLKEIFDSEDSLVVAKIILSEGEIQLTAEYRQGLIEDKKKEIIDMIHKNSVDPSTGLPHPATRIENAFAEAKVHINEFKSAKEQLEDIIKNIRPVLPLSFEVKEIEIKIPAEHAGKANAVVRGLVKIQKEDWLSDGSWLCVVEVPAATQQELFDRLNDVVHGNLESKILK